MYIYYVYAYLRSKDSATAKAGTPYYIGKGKKNRAYHKHSCSVPTDSANIIFLETNLSDIGSLALERRMISWYGRKDLGTGILLNRTDGGDGASDRSIESKQKQSDKMKGRTSPKLGIPTGRKLVYSDEAKQKMSIAKLGKARAAFTAETKEKMSKSGKGRIFTAQHREKLAESNRKRWAAIKTASSI